MTRGCTCMTVLRLTLHREVNEENALEKYTAYKATFTTSVFQVFDADHRCAIRKF